jgi:hypothetical protein
VFISKNFGHILPEYIDHPYMHLTKLKSNFLPAHLINENENTGDGMIRIMQELHNTFVPHTVPNDIMPTVVERIDFAGDVLTCERAFSAQMSMKKWNL